MYQLVDFATKKLATPDNLVFTGDSTPWEVLMDLSAVKKKLNLHYFRSVAPGLSKYLSLLPVRDATEFVSLTETATPLIKSKNLGKRLGIDLYFKLETRNLTGSFKDRGSAVEVSVAKEFGAQAMILASTGNMAASCACYAAAAKMPCFVLVPEGVPMAKLAQVVAYGGQVIQVKGDYNDAAALAKRIALKEGFYLAGDYAYRVEGQKTAAFEVVDQLFFQVPDMVVVPMGCGTNITAYAKGFQEYRDLGVIDKMPQLIGVQAKGASAIVNSYQQKIKTVKKLKSTNTIASAIAVADPLDGVKALAAINQTQGSAVAVTDTEIRHAQYLLSSEEGLFVETASAATLAALMQSETNSHYANKKIVCVLTGDGLKETQMVSQQTTALPSIYPDEYEFEFLCQNNFFNY